MSEEDFESASGRALKRRGQVVSTIIVGVVYADHPDSRISVSHLHSLVDQHPDAERFETHGDLCRVVVAEDTDDPLRRPHAPNDRLHERVDGIAGAFHFVAIVSRHHTHVDRQIRQPVRDDPGQLGQAIDVQITEVQNSEAVKSRRQRRKRKADVTNLRRAGVSDPSRVQSGGSERSPENRTDHPVMPEQEVAAPMSPPTLVMERFGLAPATETQLQIALRPGFNRAGFHLYCVNHLPFN
jgi:hypothetical protein